MAGFRCFAPNLDSESDRVTLTPFESHHLVSTNRARQGDAVVLFNGAGVEWDTVLETTDRKNASLVKQKVKTYEKPVRQITLAIALIKGKTFDTILRQATELGVSRFQPILTDYTQVQLKETTSKLNKWNTQIIEACKQSGNPWLPEIREPASLREYLSDTRFESALVASLEEFTKPWKEISPTNTCTLFIGPEGDFSTTEYQMLRDHDVQPVSLGPYVLRSETAVVAALALVSRVMG
ncbi:MAG: RsmE family RNA methyltransferase [Verrucomicrobia bacterium]|nr:RsmE family RNA methyltransferase [Verrucomicrobiota bacterium]